MIRKDWYVVSDKQGRASYVRLSDIAAVHLECDGFDVHLVEPPVCVQGDPLAVPLGGWMEIEVRQNLKGHHDCYLSLEQAEYVFQDIEFTDWCRIFSASLDSPTRWSDTVAFGFVVGG